MSIKHAEARKLHLAKEIRDMPDDTRNALNKLRQHVNSTVPGIATEIGSYVELLTINYIDEGSFKSALDEYAKQCKFSSIGHLVWSYHTASTTSGEYIYMVDKYYTRKRGDVILLHLCKSISLNPRRIFRHLYY